MRSRIAFATRDNKAGYTRGARLTAVAGRFPPDEDPDLLTDGREASVVSVTVELLDGATDGLNAVMLDDALAELGVLCLET
jgi:hypothetical protein